MILNLLWKEARENLWKAVILLFCMFFTVILDRYFDDHGDGAAVFLIIEAIIATIWIAAATSAGERSAGSLDVLLALPTRPLLLFCIKVVVGLATILLPLSVACIVISCLFSPESHDSPEFSLCSLAISVPLYFLVLTFTTTARQESRAAMIGVLALLGCVIWGGAIVLIADSTKPPLYLLTPNPLMILFADQNPVVTHSIPVQIVIACFWAVLAATRFLRTTSRTGTGSEQREVPFTNTFLVPLAYPALLWKEIREQIGIFGLAAWAALGIAVIGGLIEAGEDLRHNTGSVFWNAIGVMLQVMIAAGAIIPLFIAIVIGVGSLAGDLEDRLQHFWCGQPIPIERWFWTKYLVSIVGIFLLLVFPLSVAVAGSTMLDFSAGHDAERMRQHAWTAFIAVIIALPTAHALSIFLASIIRRTMYATVFAIIILLCIAVIPIPQGFHDGKIWIGNNLATILIDNDQTSLDIFLLFLASLLLAATLLTSSRLALTRNWRLG